MTASSVFCNAIPVLAALDISKSIMFYEQRLGFTKKFEFDNYAGVTRDAIEVHLWLCEDSHIPKNTSCRIDVKNIELIWVLYIPWYNNPKYWLSNTNLLPRVREPYTK